ncbi:MAG: hypothetical protein LBQ94_03760 [Treponema sp.]|jgi:two-component system chemotaxis sensor kinase CheA|nr:hypothetical protein [Treponema sp.]
MLLLIVKILVFASLVLSVYMIVVTMERCRSEKRYAFVYCIVTIILYTLGYFIEISCGNVGGAVIAIKVMYSGACFMSPFLFFFVADYCEINVPKKYYRIPLLVIPVLLYIVVLSFDSHHLLYTNYYYDTTKAIQSMTIEPGPLYLSYTFYPLFCVILSCVVLVRGIITQHRGRRKGLVLLLVSALAPLIANFIYVAVSFFFKTALAGINFTAFVMIISNFIFYYNVVRNDLFDLAPKAYAITLDLIRDAFVVLDLDMAYTGSNKKAVELFPALSELHKGASILGLKDWPVELFDEEGEAMGIVSSHIADSAWRAASGRNEVEFTLRKWPGKIYSGWMNSVASESGAALGWVIMIQDITETVSLIRNIRAQRDEIAAMRDNLKEGIFLMNREFIIQDSYSRAMEDVLSAKNFHGRCFTDLLSGSFSSRDLGLVADYFGMIINKSVAPELLEDINPLGEFSYTSTETGERKTLRCLFAPVDHGDGQIFVMGTIQDITAETLLKKQLADEEARQHDEMRSLFEIMKVDHTVFRYFIEDSDYEFNRAKEFSLDNEITNRQKLVNLYQSVHAIKSNAVIIGLSGFGEKLHAFEEKIKALQEGDEEPGSGDIAAITEELEKRVQDKEKLVAIFRRLSDFSASTTHVTMKDYEVFLEALKRACERVANDEGKKVKMIVKTFDKEALNLGPRRVMKDILIQLVRNSVHHGIETPEERKSLGKDETGKVTLSLTVEGDAIHMVLGDDGRGLDFNRIAQKAKAEGLLEDIPAGKIDERLLSDFIFSPGFSTSETENIHAGRGIGLSLVKDRLKEVNGQIDFQSKEGQGLVFDMRVPIN